MAKWFACALLATLLVIGAQARAQSAQDLTCTRAAQDYLQTCQKRITPVVAPVDPSHPTASEQKAMDKHTKAWQSCKEKAVKRGTACAR